MRRQAFSAFIWDCWPTSGLALQSRRNRVRTLVNRNSALVWVEMTMAFIFAFNFHELTVVVRRWSFDFRLNFYRIWGLAYWGERNCSFWREHIHKEAPISFDLMFRDTAANAADSCVVVVLVGRILASTILMAVLLQSRDILLTGI